ncbi:MAG: DinB family protein [Bryobacterales bacterium]|nr:DinB family protein [Bryobacterales bacterium]
MTNDQATFLLNIYMTDLGYECAVTRKVLAALPEGKHDYRPDPVTRTAGEIAWHLAQSEEWFLRSILNGEFPMPGDEKPPAADPSTAALVSYYEGTVLPLLDQVKNASPETLNKPIDFFGMFKNEAVTYLGFMLRHSIHHRGQLCAMLRTVGGKVPSIYGGSADEPMM